MSEFTADLQYVLESLNRAKITNFVDFYWRDDRTGEYIRLRPGMLTNFATIHKFFRFIFPHDHEDYKMPSAFHDGLVNEWGFQIWIMEDDISKRIPTWQESANWFRRMIHVRQEVRRNKRVMYKRILGIVPDFITEWSFWIMVSLYGFIR